MKKWLLFLILLLFIPGIAFAALLGDVDADGKVGSSDYILVRKHLLKTSLLTGTALTSADVNNDGSITSADYIHIRKIIIDGGKTVSVPTATPVVTQAPTATPKPTATPTPEPGKLEIHFIKAMGFYDDAIFIRSNKASIFLDGGRGKEAIIQYLNDLKITNIDYIIGSHTEYDHIDAEGDIIKNFNVGRVIYANDIYSCGCRCEANDVNSVKSGLKAKNMKAEVQPVPSKLQIGDMTLFFIAPSTLGCNKNNNSFVFILQFGNNKFMFTGDSDSPLQDVDKLTENAKSLGLADIQVDVVKYPHHGNEWLSDKFIEATNAKYYAVPNNGKCDVPKDHFYNRANPRGIVTYRQCDSSTRNFVITSDGTNIKFTLDTVASTYAR